MKTSQIFAEDRGSDFMQKGKNMLDHEENTTSVYLSPEQYKPLQLPIERWTYQITIYFCFAINLYFCAMYWNVIDFIPGDAQAGKHASKLLPLRSKHCKYRNNKLHTVALIAYVFSSEYPAFDMFLKVGLIVWRISEVYWERKYFGIVIFFSPCRIPKARPLFLSK